MRPVSFLLALSLGFLLVTPAFSKSDPLKSIRALQVITTNVKTGVESFDDICTAWATTMQQRVVWVTAMHCVAHDEDSGMPKAIDYFVDTKPVRFKLGNYDTDIAVFVGGPEAAPLVVSYLPPKVFQHVRAVGYPMDEGQVISSGIVSSLHLRQAKLVLYELPAAPGVSGAPVLADDNVVVGILQNMACPYLVGYCPMVLGVSLTEIRETLHLDD